MSSLIVPFHGKEQSARVEAAAFNRKTGMITLFLPISKLFQTSNSGSAEKQRTNECSRQLHQHSNDVFCFDAVHLYRFSGPPFLYLHLTLGQLDPSARCSTCYLHWCYGTNCSLKFWSGNTVSSVYGRKQGIKMALREAWILNAGNHVSKNTQVIETCSSSSEGGTHSSSAWKHEYNVQLITLDQYNSCNWLIHIKPSHSYLKQFLAASKLVTINDLEVDLMFTMSTFNRCD